MADNQRQIKFRVWNNAKQEWIHGPGDEVNLFGEMILMGGFMQGVLLEELNDCIALQFTGVHDSAGVEIFEGDIVEFATELNVFISIDDKNAPEIMRSAVIYDDGGYCFKGQYGYEGREIRFDQVTVIGNIHLHQHLLTEAK